MSPDDCPNALAPGTRILDYTILSVIGTGGFSIVYKAMDNALRRVVAIKEYFPPSFAVRETDGTVRPHSRDADTFRTGIVSFLNEGKLLAQFDHPALVRVYRCWEESGTAYLAMRLYTGATLRDAVKAGNFVLTQSSMQVLLQPLLDTLELLHNGNCYHRDVAPDNILLSDTQMPVLLDFGAARRAIEGTQVFTAILKPGYAPIEQYGDGEMKQGPWTDLYALAGVVVFALNGQPPPTAISRLMKDNMPRPQEQFKDRLPERWLDALERALAVKPEDRPRSVEEFRGLLGWEKDAFVSSATSYASNTVIMSAAEALLLQQPASAAMASALPDLDKTVGLTSVARLAGNPAAQAEDERTVVAARKIATPRLNSMVDASEQTPRARPQTPEATLRSPSSARAVPASSRMQAQASVVAPADGQPSASVTPTMRSSTRRARSATTKSPRPGSRAGIWIAALAGLVAVGALAMFLKGGSKPRANDPTAQPGITNVRPSMPPPATVTPPSTLPATNVQALTPPAAQGVDPLPQSVVAVPVIGVAGAVEAPKGVAPEAGFPRANVPPGSAPQSLRVTTPGAVVTSPIPPESPRSGADDRVAKDNSKASNRKPLAAITNDEPHDDDDAANSSTRTGNRSATRCTRDFGLGTSTAADDEAFSGRRCR